MLPVPDENLLLKFLDNNCTPDEAMVVLTWLSTPEGQSFADDRFDKETSTLDMDDQKSIGQPIRSIHMFQQILQKINFQKTDSIRRTHRMSQNWIKIAAAIFIPLLITNAIFWLVIEKPTNKVLWQEVYVPKGEKLQVMFQDGTKVWLNSDTKLEYPAEFSGNQRQVKLEGEAYFVVKKNPKKPFIVRLNDLNIKVTGTSFNVKAFKDENMITTTLDEGKICLVAQQKGKPVEYKIQPGQQASYLKAGLKVSIFPSTIGQNSSWKENKLTFKDTPLQEVVKVLERWYNVKFEINDPTISHYTYTISFHNEPLQNVLFGLEKLTPVRCQLKNGKVQIKKKLNNF